MFFPSLDEGRGFLRCSHSEFQSFIGTIVVYHQSYKGCFTAAAGCKPFFFMQTSCAQLTKDNIIGKSLKYLAGELRSTVRSKSDSFSFAPQGPRSPKSYMKFHETECIQEENTHSQQLRTRIVQIEEGNKLKHGNPPPFELANFLKPTMIYNLIVAFSLPRTFV